MAGDLDPEEWAEIMNDAFRFLTAPIHRYEGTVARLMGDAVLAFFGAPVAHEDDPQRAVLAGLAILEEMAPFCERIREAHGLDFNVRVGVNTGPVVAGTVGTDRAMEYTAMGDAVNVAARMEQTADPGTLQVSEDTYRFIAPLFEFEPLGDVDLKGKQTPIRTYRVLGAAPRPGSLRGIEGLRSPLVGRTSEMMQLNEALQATRQGRGGIVFLLGEAGLGKSRLIAEMQSAWGRDERQNKAWAQTQGVSYDSSRPYSIFSGLMRSLLEVDADAEREVVQEKIVSFAEGWPEDRRQIITQAVQSLFAVHHGGELSPHAAEALKRELTEAQLELWRETALKEPFMAVFDDLHWADSASVELLEQLFTLSDEVQLLIVCAMRPHRQSPAWELKAGAERDYPHRLTEIKLDVLGSDESASLVDNLLTIADLPADIRRLILGKAEGNPFFVEEIIRALIDEGVIQRDISGTRWISTKAVQELDLPDNLQALLVSRIDRLDQEFRRTLQLASVIGRNFLHRILASIVDAVDVLQTHLNKLQRVGLIYEVGRVPELEYAFLHELTRDAAYQTILRSRRKEFHLRVGETIESIYKGGREEEAHRLGRHFREAGDAERAARYYLIAGDRAASIFANAEAIQHYRAALDCMDTDASSVEQVQELHRKLGRSYELSNQYDDAMRTYENLQAIGERRGARSLSLAGMVSRATLYATPTSYLKPRNAKELSSEALGLARDLGNPQAEVRALWNLCLAEQGLGIDRKAGIRYGEDAAVIAREHGFMNDLAFVLHDLARGYSEVGMLEEALATAMEAQALFREQDNLPMLADNLGLMTELHHWQGDMAAAEATAREGIEIGKKIGNPWAEGYNTWTLAFLYAEKGYLWSSAQLLERAARLAEQAQFAPGNLGPLHGFLSWIYALVGDYDRALAELKRMEELGGVVYHAFVTRIHALLDDWDQVRNSLALVREQFPQILQLPAPASEIMLSVVGDSALALDHVSWLLEETERVLQDLENSGSFMFLADILHLRAKALLAAGRVEDGLGSLDQAREAAERLGSKRAMLPIYVSFIEVAQERDDADEVERLQLESHPILDRILEDLPDVEMRAKFRATPVARALTP